jgi:hypothetical protein
MNFYPRKKYKSDNNLIKQDIEFVKKQNSDIKINSGLKTKLKEREKSVLIKTLSKGNGFYCFWKNDEKIYSIFCPRCIKGEKFEKFQIEALMSINK